MGIKKITTNMNTEINKEETIGNDLRKDSGNQEEVKTCDTSINGSDKIIDTQEKYFQKCLDEYYEIENLDTKEHKIDLIVNVFEPWRNVDKTKVEQKDCSGHGGSKTYVFTANDQSVQEKYKKLIFHQRNLDDKDPLTEERMCDAQKAFYDSGVAIPRYVSGKDWYIEPYIEEDRENDKKNY